MALASRSSQFKWGACTLAELCWWGWQHQVTYYRHQILFLDSTVTQNLYSSASSLHRVDKPIVVQYVTNSTIADNTFNSLQNMKVLSFWLQRQKYINLTIFIFSVESHVPKTKQSNCGSKKDKIHVVQFSPRPPSYSQRAMPTFSPPGTSAPWKQPVLIPLQKKLFHSLFTATFFPLLLPVPQFRYTPLPMYRVCLPFLHVVVAITLPRPPQTTSIELLSGFDCKQQSLTYSCSNRKHFKK